MQAVDERVPGDVSAAAFWLVAGAIHPDAELTLRDVGVNPTRRAVIDLLRRMGADIEERAGRRSAEPTPRRRRRRADRRPRRPLARRSARIDLGPAEVAAGDRRDPGPVPRRGLARAARPVIRGAGELRHKESDRIAGHRGRSARARRAGRGRRRRPRDPRRRARSHGAETDSLDDHRLAMTFAVAGLVADGETTVGRPGVAAISYPGFFADLERVRA